jgi:hypothetical protein
METPVTAPQHKAGEVTRHNVAKLLAAAFVDRVNRVGIKGKAARDKAALEFFVGAAVAYNLAGQVELCEAVRVALSFSIAVRGYRAIEEMAGEPHQTAKNYIPRRRPRRDPDQPDTPSLEDRGIYAPDYSS